MHGAYPVLIGERARQWGWGGVDVQPQYVKFLGQKPYVIHGQDSFPSFKEDEIQHPDLGMLLSLNHSRIIDLRLIYLRRDPVDAICSTIRRFPNDEPWKNVRVAEDTLMSLNTRLRHVPFDTVDYETISKDPYAVAPTMRHALRDILSVDAVDAMLRQEGTIENWKWGRVKIAERVSYRSHSNLHCATRTVAAERLASVLPLLDVLGH